PGKEVMEEEVYYWMGRSNYHQGQLFDAKDAFIQSIELGLTLPNTKNRRFHTLSAFYAGRSSENLNDTEEAKKYYEITLAQNESEDVKEVAKTRLKTL
ncbi:MAG: tetratricopeptide repeat protein, partial [Balneolaceae bacterium]